MKVKEAITRPAPRGTKTSGFGQDEIDYGINAHFVAMKRALDLVQRELAELDQKASDNPLEVQKAKRALKDKLAGLKMSLGDDDRVEFPARVDSPPRRR